MEELRTILLEGKYDSMLQLNDWKKMFQLADRLPAFVMLQTKLKDHLKWAKQKLKREDRIVWYLRHRIMLDMGQLMPNIKDYKEVEQLTNMWNRIAQNYRKKSGESVTFDSHHNEMKFQSPILNQAQRRSDHGSFENWLEHSISLDRITAIQSFTFDKQRPMDVKHAFDVAERKWKDLTKRLVPDYEETVMIDMGSFKWFDLERSSCGSEAEAMGHCGNSPSQHDTNQTILSLREEKKVNGEIWWKVHATFILHKKEKALGETKGFGNEKPSPKLHKYIIELLMHKRIQRIDGGGYLPESNFSIRDLPEVDQKKITKKKPQLLSLLDRIISGGVPYLTKLLKDDKHSEVIDDVLVMTEHDDIIELVEDYGDDSLQHYIAFVVGDEHFEVYDFENPDKGGIENNISPEDLKTIMKIWEEDADEDDEYDDWFEYAKNERPDIINSINNAWGMALETGSSDEIYKAVKSTIDGGFDGELLVITNGTNWDYDSTFKVGVTISAMVSMARGDHTFDGYYTDPWDGGVNTLEELTDGLAEMIDELESDLKLKLDVPYHGFGGFDEPTFKEFALEDMDRD